MIAYRHADPRFPFLWESAAQPAGRWNRADEGPVQYLADTPDGAWAEFIRHEGITSEAELDNVRRALWAVEIPGDGEWTSPDLPDEVLRGDLSSYPVCQAEASRLRDRGDHQLRALSAALESGGARGFAVRGGLQPGRPRDGFVLVLFGIREDLTGWPAAMPGRPHGELLSRVRPLK